jgi:outer membrane biosynthesis protein TonB
MAVFQDRLNLPWSSERQENRRFSAILIILFAVLIILSLWIPFIKVPEKEREQLEKLPPQLAKLVQKKEEPKPVKKEEPKPAPKAEPKPEPKPEVKEIEPKPEPKKKEIPPKLEKPKVVKDKDLTKEVKQARDVARKSGLLALQNDLSDLKTVVDVNKLKQNIAPRTEKTIAAKAGSVATSDVMRRSAGIQTEGLSAPVESVQLAARDGTLLDATDAEIALAKAEAEAASRVRPRSQENIRLTAESLKSAFNKLYTRELRQDPFLEGVLMLEVVIEPSGLVSFCRVVSSELNNPEFEAKIVSRMYLADFGEANVLQTTINIPFPFHPN